MKRVLPLVLVLIASLSLGQPANEAVALLRHMLDAAPRLRYTGTRNVTMKQGVDRRAHIEMVEKDGVNTRVEFPNNSPSRGQVIVENGRERRHYNPGRNEIRIQPTRRERALIRLQKIISMPGVRRRLQLTDGGNVAGMHTMLVTLTTPKGDPLQRLWIEPRSGLLVKREMYDRTGTLEGGFEFTQVNLNPRVDPRDFQLAIHSAKVISPRDELRQFAKRLLLPEIALRSDATYQLDSAKIQKVGNLEVLVQQYSSDERNFSFFVLRGSVDPSKLRQQASGLQSLSWQKDGVTYALVGDLESSELSDVARQLGYSG